MRILTTSKFDKALEKAPERVQQEVARQLDRLLLNARHPSLFAEKFPDGRWQVRVNIHWRMYYRIDDGAYVMLDVTPHPK